MFMLLCELTSLKLFAVFLRERECNKSYLRMTLRYRWFIETFIDFQSVHSVLGFRENVYIN